MGMHFTVLVVIVGINICQYFHVVSTTIAKFISGFYCTLILLIWTGRSLIENSLRKNLCVHRRLLRRWRKLKIASLSREKKKTFFVG